MKFLVWLFIILCVQALSSLAVEILSTTRARDFVLSKHRMQEEEATGIYRKTSLYGGIDGREYGLKQAKIYSRKGQKGKGSYGGANIVHHPRPAEKSASSVPKRSLFFILLSTILYAGFSLVPLFPF